MNGEVVCISCEVFCGERTHAGRVDGVDQSQQDFTVVHFFLAKNQQTQNLSSCQFMTNTQVINTTQTLSQQCTVLLVKDSFLQKLSKPVFS